MRHDALRVHLLKNDDDLNVNEDNKILEIPCEEWILSFEQLISILKKYFNIQVI